MKRISCLTIAILFVFQISLFAKKTDPSKTYKFTIDLVNVSNDKVKVELLVPAITEANIIYHIPKIVPGTYSEDDFGRYIEDLEAFDKKGNKVNVVKSDVDSWMISPANKLYKLTYLVNDTYDDSTTKQVIFEPAGSNIENDSNYVVNNHCFLGYFEGMKDISYELTVEHPAYMYGSTALTDMDRSSGKDKFIVESYNRIVDNPIMYCRPDTAFVKVGNSDVLISIYSPNNKVSAKYMAEKLDTLLQAQAKYLGGKLPVDKYAFLIYLFTKQGYSGGYGALEHSYSSMYYYPEMEQEDIWHSFVDFASHEFFHIITPLTIHSEEIQNFGFNEPRMSEHLWLYEGSTEYHSYMVQAKYGLITYEDLLRSLGQLIATSKNRYNDTLAFTTMSKYVLHQYKNQFQNVYVKGALINLCLDIKLLQLSNGKYNIMNLIHDLSQKYGKQRAFKDDELFDEIQKLTYPEIGTFLKNCVGGGEALPFKEVFNAVGVNYQTQMQDSVYSFGGARLRLRPTQDRKRLMLGDTTNMDLMGRRLGYRNGDELIAINGEEITLLNANSVFSDYLDSVKEGDNLTVKVMRKDENGESKEIELNTTMIKVPVTRYHVLSFMEHPSDEQLVLRNAWLKKNEPSIKGF